MISPLAKIALCLLGIAAAGLPLVYFTAPAGKPALPAPAASACEPGKVATPVVLRCSGSPQYVRLWLQGQLLCELTPQAGVWQGELPLPSSPLIELEVQAAWPVAAGAQAITIEISPPSLPARQDTQWALPPAAHELHSIFSFSWQ